MKIVFCLHHFLPEYVGGTEIYTFRLAQELLKAGYGVSVIVPNFHHSTSQSYIHDGINVIKYAENSVEDRKMILGKRKPDGISEFIKIIQEEQPDLVHFHELAPGMGLNFYHVEALHFLGIPVVTTLHVPLYTCLKGTLVYKDQEQCDGRIIVERCTACIYHSKKITGVKGSLLNFASHLLFKWNADTTLFNNSIGTALGFPFVIKNLKATIVHLSHLSDRVVVLADWYRSIVISNGVAPEKLVTIKQDPVGSLTAPGAAHVPIQLPLKIVYLGRITKLKGLHLLIEAIVSLPHLSVSLDIFGQESDAGYVATCKNSSAGNSNIYWRSAIPSSEVASALSKYHVLCLPSAFEMNPLVIQESFAAGLPVLASDVYGNAEQITDGVNGWLFRFNDSAHLYQKLQLLICDTNLIETARKNLPVMSSFKEIGDRHLSLYSEIIANRKVS